MSIDNTKVHQKVCSFKSAHIVHVYELHDLCIFAIVTADLVLWYHFLFVYKFFVRHLFIKFLYTIM